MVTPLVVVKRIPILVVSNYFNLMDSGLYGTTIYKGVESAVCHQEEKYKDFGPGLDWLQISPYRISSIIHSCMQAQCAQMLLNLLEKKWMPRPLLTSWRRLHKRKIRFQSFHMRNFLFWGCPVRRRLFCIFCTIFAAMLWPIPRVFARVSWESKLLFRIWPARSSFLGIHHSFLN